MAKVRYLMHDSGRPAKKGGGSNVYEYIDRGATILAGITIPVALVAVSVGLYRLLTW